MSKLENVIDDTIEKYRQQDFGGFIESKVRMRHFRDFNPDVGVDGIQFIGLPGSGKTNFAMLLCKDLMKIKGENILMSADRFCEFRHFFRYPRMVNKIMLFLPEETTQELFFYGIPSINNEGKKLNTGLINAKYRVPFETHYVDFETFDIKDYLYDGLESTVFAVYDQHFQGDYLWKRAELWKNITRQLLERTVLLDGQAITTLFNEGGVLFQESASDKHWTQIKSYAELIVECRKGLVRPIQLSQLETEINHLVRKKLIWKCYRIGTTSGKGIPPPVQKASSFQSRANYILLWGNLYSIGNRVPKLSELKETWKIIPVGNLHLTEEQSGTSKFTTRNGIVKKLYEEGFTQARIAEIFEITQQTISKILAKT